MPWADEWGDTDEMSLVGRLARLEAENTFQLSDSVSPQRVTEMSVSPEVAVVQPIAYKLGHGLQKSKFVFSQAELARCMTGAGATGPSCFLWTPAAVVTASGPVRASEGGVGPRTHSRYKYLFTF